MAENEGSRTHLGTAESGLPSLPLRDTTEWVSRQSLATCHLRTNWRITFGGFEFIIGLLSVRRQVVDS